MHRMKRASSYMLVVACLFLAAAGSLREGQAESQPVSSSSRIGVAGLRVFQGQGRARLP